MKKILLLLTLSLCTLGAWAQDDFYNDGSTLKFTITTGTNEVSVTQGTTAPTGDLVIPASVTNGGTTYSVTIIGNSAFENCSGLTSVTIPNSVTTIGASAFWYCFGLTSVTIPNSVTSIGSSAFHNCSGLTSVTIPNSVTNIGSSAFRNCSGLTSVTIPNSVTNIGSSAFRNCRGLTSVTIPNSVTSIGGSAFNGCSGLTSVTIPNSVTNIGGSAFYGCSGLKTVYNLSTLPLTPGASDNGYVAMVAERVIVPNTFGTGANVLSQIPDTYSVVTTEDNQVNHIPANTIPTNFIYNDGSNWKAKKIVLTDDSSRFEVPVAFTADEVTYTREFTNSNRSTLYLPFAVAEASMPEDLEVYEFSGFNGSSISFAEHTGGIAAYTPYLVGYDISSKDGNPTKCTFNLTNVAFSVTPAASTNAITNNGMTFQGTTQRTCMTSSNYGYSNGYFVQSGNGGDHTGHAHVNPFRCYFTYSASGPMGIPPTLDIDLTNNGLTGIETPDKPVRQNNIRYSDDVFDTMGRLVRKHAKDLEGLPRGIYIWKGKKVLHFND